MIDPDTTITLAPIDADEDAMLWRTVRRLARAHHDHKRATLARFGWLWLAWAFVVAWLVVLTVIK